MDFKTINKPQKAALLVSNCFHARTLAHISHLQTTSYAQHVALNSFYSGIVDLTDAFAESFQGRYGIIGSYPAPSISGGGVELVKNLRIWIDQNRAECGSQSELQNDIDSIVALCNSTIYKLTNLH